MYEKLIDFLKSKSENSNAQEELSKVLDFKQATASRKLNGIIDFKASEMRYIKKYYDISAELIVELFEL